MKIFITTDTHFGHYNMIDYCDRPENFAKKIYSGLINNCKMGDVLIHLGDVCIGKDEYWHNEYIKPLPCKKWLVRGNHDNKSDKWYLDHGWDWVGMKFQMYYKGKSILFTHIPEVDRKLDERLFGAGSFDINIHGHFHNTLERLKKKEWVSPEEEKRNEGLLDIICPKHKLIALEFTNYQPVSLDKLLI